jgi:hypothetical protein
MSVQATPNKTAINLLRSYKMEAFKLPAPDERTRLSDLRDAIGHDLVYRFRAHDILERGDPLGDDVEFEGHWWHTNRTAYAYLHENYDEPTLTPCGCSNGIQCVEAGEVYTCQNDDCSETFDRETAEEVVA